jgi:hypothetical protein
LRTVSRPSTSPTFQAEARPVGSFEVTTLPELSTATQSFVTGQETPLRLLSASTSSTFQAEVPSAGFFEVTMSPESSPATQSLGEGQETLKRMLPPSTSVTRQAEAPPVGSVEVTTLPELSTATQSFGDGQETPSRAFPPSASTIVQAEAPPVGSVEVTRLPTSSTATQSFLDGQETPSRALCTDKSAGVQAKAPSAGSVEVTSLPTPSTATQSFLDWQETPRRGLGCPEAECCFTAGVLQVTGRAEVTAGAGAAISTPEIVTKTVATLARRVIPMRGRRIRLRQGLLGTPAASAASGSPDHRLLEFRCRHSLCPQSFSPIARPPLAGSGTSRPPRLERSPSMSRRSQTGFPSAGATVSGGLDVGKDAAPEGHSEAQCTHALGRRVQVDVPGLLHRPHEGVGEQIPPRRVEVEAVSASHRNLRAVDLLVHLELPFRTCEEAP